MPGDSDGWVSVEEAARRLGVSDATVRRRVRAGTLEGERLARPQGEVYRVRESALPPSSQVTAPDTPEVLPPDSRLPAERLLGVIDALLHANGETMIRQAETLERYFAEITTLREERGRLQAERDNALARANELAEQLAAERARAEAAEARAARPWWQRIWGR